jgi:hypothetical protein
VSAAQTTATARSAAYLCGPGAGPGYFLPLPQWPNARAELSAPPTGSLSGSERAPDGFGPAHFGALLRRRTAPNLGHFA